MVAVGKGIDDGKLLRGAFNVLLGIRTDLIVVLDSKDLFRALSTCRKASGRSVRVDVNAIRFEFETHAVSRMIWTPARGSLADPLTKNDSPLFDALHLLFFTAAMPFALSRSISCSPDQSKG